ncbi:MAG: bifunctional ADP-heptose synthase [Tunicatimonas sp.]
MESSFDLLFDTFARHRVLIVGDVMVDAYVWGRVERVSPEAPVPVVRVNRRESRLGGAANVALNVQALGATPLLCAVVGTDAPGDAFRQLLVDQGIATDYVVSSSERTTTVKERVIAGPQQVVRIDDEHDHLLSDSEREALLSAADQALVQADVVIFQDYDKGVLSEAVIRHITERAQQRGIPVAVDPKKRNFLHYHNASLFKPNLKELRQGLQQERLALHHETYAPLHSEPAAIREAAATLRGLLHHQITLITRSEKGVFIDTDTDEAHFMPAHVRQIADVSGAGDTVISIAALCLASAAPLPTLAALANLGGGIVCEYTGVVPISRDRLLTEANEHLAGGVKG